MGQSKNAHHTKEKKLNIGGSGNLINNMSHNILSYWNLKEGRKKAWFGVRGDWGKSLGPNKVEKMGLRIWAW